MTPEERALINRKFTVNGVPMFLLVKEGGLKVTENDIDAWNAGRTLDGQMQRGRVAQKKKLEVEFLPLNDTNASLVLSATSPEYVEVSYPDPMAGTQVTKTMYNSSRPAACLHMDEDGHFLWQDIKLSLIER